MSNIFDKALSDYADELLAALPATVREDISRANNDLYSGPSYYDVDGNESSCFDDGALAFDFNAAVKRISRALDDIHVVYIVEDGFVSDCEPKGDWIDGEEPIQGAEEDSDEYDARRLDAWCEPADYYLVEPCDIIRAMVGRELASYL